MEDKFLYSSKGPRGRERICEISGLGQHNSFVMLRVQIGIVHPQRITLLLVCDS
jgi:hypothetical protein